MENKVAILRDKRFQSVEEFEIWLTAKTFKRLDFVDMGHDLMIMHIHETGEVIHCNAHSGIYCGKFANLNKLTPGLCLELWDNDTQEYVIYGKLIIEEVI